MGGQMVALKLGETEVKQEGVRQLISVPGKG